MSEQPPILEGRPPTPQDQRLVKLFDEIEAGQLDLLDAAGKRIIELASLLLGVIFGATALHENFPAPFLQESLVKVLLCATLVFLLLAMAAAMRVVRPRLYRRHTYNLTEMQKELGQIIQFKSGALRLAGALFWVASALLALTVLVIILTA